MCLTLVSTYFTPLTYKALRRQSNSITFICIKACLALNYVSFDFRILVTCKTIPQKVNNNYNIHKKRSSLKYMENRKLKKRKDKKETKNHRWTEGL